MTEKLDLTHVQRIALHRYAIDRSRLGAAARLRVDEPRQKRYLLDPTGLNTRILRSPQMEVLLHAYVTRRVICAGRLLVLFAWLQKEAERKPLPLPSPAKWEVRPHGAVVQITRSIGGAGYTQACHTAPSQVVVVGQYPWTLARSVAVKQEFVTWFGNIYVMPDLVNETDSYVEAEDGLDNRNLFASAVSLVLKGADAVDTLAAYTEQLSARIATSGEYLFDGVHKDWMLGTYLAAMAAAVPLAQKVLPAYRTELPA